MDLEAQKRAPIYEALERFRKKRVVPFDVPGHKRGRGNPELAALLGEKCVGLDVNSMKPLDNLCHPVSVIREAEELAAEAFGAVHSLECEHAPTHELAFVTPEGSEGELRGKLRALSAHLEPIQIMRICD